MYQKICYLCFLVIYLTGFTSVLIANTFETCNLNNQNRLKPSCHNSPVTNNPGTLQTMSLRLSFLGGESYKRFKQGEKHQIIAKITSTGSGRVYITWEIASPPFSNNKNPVFIPIKQTQTILVGSLQKKLLSPVLPSNQIGKYLVRINIQTVNSTKNLFAFSIQSSHSSNQSSTISYQVTYRKVQNIIQLLGSPIAINVDKNTQFSWRTNASVSQFILQIFAKKISQKTCNILKSQPYLTAIVTSGRTQTKITPLVANKLQSGKSYCWRVLAYDKGRLVATSENRPFIWKTTESTPATLITSNDNDENVQGQVVIAVNNKRERQQLNNNPDLQVISEIQLRAYPLKIVLVKSRSNRSETELISELRQQFPNIAVQPNYIYRLNGSNVPQYSLSIMKVKRSNKQAGSGVRIGMIDTLVDTRHPSLRTAKIKQINLLPNNNNGKIHGTAIASLIVGKQGINGIVPAAKLISIAAFHAKAGAKSAGKSSSFLLAKAFDNALLQRVKILNLSFGSSQPDPLLKRLIKRTKKQRIILVASVGNSAKHVYYPAALSSVIAVTATDANNKLYLRANRGSQVELAAPGVAIMAARSGGKYTRMSGTSFATAHITGLIAYLISQHQAVHRSALRNRAKDLGKKGKDRQFGYGLLTL